MSKKPKKSDWRSEWPEEADGGARVPLESKNPNENPFVISELGQVAPTVPIRWVDHDSADWPYQNPGEEFVRTAITLDQLCRRWSGLYPAAEIHADYHRADWMGLRFQYRDQMMQKALENSLASDAKFQARIINDDIIGATHVIDILTAELNGGVEYRPARGQGVGMGYVEMPMTADARAKISNAIERQRNLRATRAGVATQISKQEHDVSENLADLLRRDKAATDPRYRELLEQSGLKVQALPPGQEYESVSVEVVEETANVKR